MAAGVVTVAAHCGVNVSSCFMQIDLRIVCQEFHACHPGAASGAATNRVLNFANTSKNGKIDQTGAKQQKSAAISLEQ